MTGRRPFKILTLLLPMLVYMALAGIYQLFGVCRFGVLCGGAGSSNTFTSLVVSVLALLTFCWVRWESRRLRGWMNRLIYVLGCCGALVFSLAFSIALFR